MKNYLILLFLVILNIAIEDGSVKYRMDKDSSVSSLREKKTRGRIDKYADILKADNPGLAGMSDEDVIRKYFTIYPEHLKYLPFNIGEDIFPQIFLTPGERLYRECGTECVAGFGERFMFQFKKTGLYVIGSIQGLLGIYQPHNWVSDQIRTLETDDTEIQAYLAWQEDEPVSWSNFWHFDLAMRGLSEMLPPISIMFGVVLTILGINSVISKTSYPTFFTLMVRGIILIISLIPIALIFELSKQLIPLNVVGGAIRGIIAFSLFWIVFNNVNKLHVTEPTFVKLIVGKIKSLPTGVYRLSLVLWVVIPIIFCIISLLNEQELFVLIALVSFIFYWPLFFTVMWVLEGFNKQNSAK